jgi:hypothetical protein
MAAPSRIPPRAPDPETPRISGAPRIKNSLRRRPAAPRPGGRPRAPPGRVPSPVLPGARVSIPPRAGSPRRGRPLSRRRAPARTRKPPPHATHPPRPLPARFRAPRRRARAAPGRPSRRARARARRRCPDAGTCGLENSPPRPPDPTHTRARGDAPLHTHCPSVTPALFGFKTLEGAFAGGVAAVGGARAAAGGSHWEGANRSERRQGLAPGAIGSARAAPGIHAAPGCGV